MNKRLTGLIIAEMELQNWTISKMAKELKCSKQYLSKLLNGGINIYYLERITEILNLEVLMFPKRYL